MSRTVKKVSTGSSYLGADTVFNGEIDPNPCNLDYATITAFTGASLGTNFFRVNLYDATNSGGGSFIDLAIRPDESETFTIMRDIKNALHGVFTGSGALTVTIRR